jgi:hypothetical protein
MTDEQEGARVGAEHLHQRVEGLEVDVVGGLVEHQQVGRHGEAPSSSGVPPKVRVMPVSWRSGGAWAIGCAAEETG